MKPLTWVLAAVCLLTGAVCNADSKQKVRVAFVISDGFDLIDFAGPWEVFQDVMLGPANDNMDMPYELYTVSSSKSAVTSSGGARVVQLGSVVPFAGDHDQVRARGIVQRVLRPDPGPAAR